MLSLHLSHDSVLGMLWGFWATVLNAEWLEGAAFVTAPAPICLHFNYPTESRPFFCFGQPQDFKLGPNKTHFITGLLAI